MHIIYIYIYICIYNIYNITTILLLKELPHKLNPQLNPDFFLFFFFSSRSGRRRTSDGCAVRSRRALKRHYFSKV